MERVPEPELMDEIEQARAYASADFSDPHAHFIRLLTDRLGDAVRRGAALDLGCGPGDISFRLAEAWPGWTIEGIDGAQAMLELAEQDPRRAALADRVSFTLARLPAAGPAAIGFDLVFSNSLLHHLADPLDLWRAAIRHAAPGARLFVMDLLRPPSPRAACKLVSQYAAGEPDVLQHDFYASLLAAYRVAEVEAQLAAIGLGGVTVEVVSDRHWIAHGPLAAAPRAGEETSP